jgi:dienelactone hydrolase
MLLSDLLRLESDVRSSTVTTPAEWEAKADDIRRRMAPVLGNGPGVAPDLDAVVISEEKCDGYLRRLIEYSVEDDERARAYVLVPSSDAPLPAMLCLHQTAPAGKLEPVGLGGNDDTSYAHHLALRRYVCIAPDHLAAGDRIASGLEAYDTAAFYEKHPDWSAVGKGMWDASRAVDVLDAMPEVDSERIGAIGHSLGGHSSIFAAAFDERIKACVSNCGLATFADNPQRLHWARDHWYVYIRALRPIFLAGLPAPFDMHEMVALIAPRACLNISSLTDTSTPGSDRALVELAWRVRGVYKLLGAEGSFSVNFHDMGHRFHPESRAFAYAWLDSRLGNTALL